MKRNFILLMLGVCTLLLAPCVYSAGNLSLPAGTGKILEEIYSGRIDLAIPEAQTLQRAQPEHPLGYLLEAEAVEHKVSRPQAGVAGAARARTEDARVCCSVPQAE